MRLATCAVDEEAVLGVVTTDGIQLLPAADGWPTSMLDWIAVGQDAAERFRLESAGLRVTPQERVCFRAPIPRPRNNLVYLGKNTPRMRSSFLVRKATPAPNRAIRADHPVNPSRS